MLEELYKQHDNWLRIAFNICKDKETSKDLVQNMYLKMTSIDEKKYINTNYIWSILRNQYISKLRRDKKFDYIEDVIYNLEDIDESQELLEDRIMIDDKCKDLGDWYYSILLGTSEKSLNKFSEEIGIHRSTLNYQRQIGLKKLKDIL